MAGNRERLTLSTHRTQPAIASPVVEVGGKYAGPGPTVDDARAADDADEIGREERLYRRTP
jgi:hypothetical protein